MSKKLYEESNIQGIASAIREKNGTQNQYTVAQMPAAVRAIKTQPELEALTVTENGNYLPSAGKDGFSSVEVEVESIEAVIQPLSVAQNGIYTPPSGVDGYAPVTVTVEGGGDIEPELPAEYQEVEYIDFDGNSYVTINTQPIQNGDIFETVVQYINDNDSYGNDKDKVAIGTSAYSFIQRFEVYYKNGELGIYCAGPSYSDTPIARGAIDDNAYSPSNGASSYYLGHKSVSLGDKSYVMIGFIIFNPSSPNYLKIGGYGPNNNTYSYNNRLFKIKHSIEQLTSGNVAQSTFFKETARAYTWIKPCYRKSDNIPGWYDTTNNVFHINEGTGTFTVGPDVI